MKVKWVDVIVGENQNSGKSKFLNVKVAEHQVCEHQIGESLVVERRGTPGSQVY